MRPKTRSGAALLYVLMLLFVVTLVMSGLVLWAAKARHGEDLAYRQLRMETLLQGAEAYAPTLLRGQELQEGGRTTLYDGPFGEGSLTVRLQRQKGPEHRLELTLRLGKDDKASTMRLWGLRGPAGVALPQPAAAVMAESGQIASAFAGRPDLHPSLVYSKEPLLLPQTFPHGDALAIDAPATELRHPLEVADRLVIHGDLRLAAPLKAKALYLDGALTLDPGGAIDAETLYFSPEALAALPDPIPETIHGERQTLAADNRIWYYVLDYALEREIS